MKTMNILKAFVSLQILAVVSMLAHAQTDLATTPIVANGKFGVPPNIMFVLDDSESMSWTYLPDWAGGKNNSNRNIRIPIYAWQHNNSSFNGLAYNPKTEYKPPVYFNASGVLDKTTYPAQNKSETTGWTKVQDNPYKKIESGGGTHSDLNKVAYYYTTTPGEFCTNKGKRVCQNAKDDTHTEAAPLRWCNSPENATKAVPDVNSCQAVQIDNIGSQNVFGYPRMPSPLASVIDVKGGNTITSIKINGKEILPNTVTASTKEDLATALVNAITDGCFFYETGACTVAGYLALEKSNAQVYIYAPDPAVKAIAPIIDSSDNTKISATSFDTAPDNLVSGSIKLTQIIEGRTYPKVAGAKRADCADNNFCTYDEEMTNYANWWAYYRTRMQSIKTAASHSFESVSEKYRVGFISMNNKNATSQMEDAFLNIDNFSDSHKKLWYDKMFGTTEKGETPLRQVLSQVGQIYAGKINGDRLPQTFGSGSKQQIINDPVQFSCQKNVTILSTDGYWNEENLPGLKLDGRNSVGDQDGPEILPEVLRPQLDLGVPKYGKTTEQRKKIITPTVPTSKQLQEETTQSLRAQLMKLEKAQPQQKISTLQEKVINLQKGVYPLQGQTSTLQKRTALLKQRVYKYWAVSNEGSKWQQKLIQRQKRTYTGDTWTQKRSALQTRTSKLQQQVSNLQRRTATLNTQSANLMQKIWQLQAKTIQVQQRTSSNGVTWSSWANVSKCIPEFQTVECRQLAASDWTNVASCEKVSTPSPQLVNAGMDSEHILYTTNRDCQYLEGAWTNTSSCQSAGKDYDGNAIDCKYDTYSTLQPVGSGGSCTIVAPSSGSGTWTGPAVNCVYVWSAFSNADTCSPVAASTGTAFTQLNPVECTYSTWSGVSNPTTCKNVAQSANFDVKQAVSCSYSSWTSWTNASACAPKEKSTGTDTWSVATAAECQYIATSDLTTQASCTVTANPNTYPSSIIITGCTLVQGSWSAWANAKDCTADAVTQCQELVTQDWKDVSSCTESTSSTGLIAQCRRIRPEAPCDIPGTVPGSTNECVTAWDDWVEVGSCTPKSTNPTAVGDVQCQYDSWSSYINVGSCTPQAMGTSSTPTWIGPAVGCTYTAWSAWANDTTCVRKDQSASNSTGPFEPSPKQCQYASTATWANATGACTSTNPTIGGVGVSNPSEKIGCQYNPSATWSNATSSCTPVSKSTGSTLTVLQAKECQYVEGTWQNVASCAEVAKSTTSPYTVLEAVECASTWGDWQAADTCTVQAAGGTGAETQCKYDEAGATWVDTTAAGCTKTNPVPTGPNYSDKYITVDCKSTVTKDWYDVPADSNYQCPSPNPYISGNVKYTCRYVFKGGVLVPQTETTILKPGETCHAVGTDDTPEKNIVVCPVLTTGPTLVDYCVAEPASSANDFTETTCPTRDANGKLYATGPTPDTLADVAQYYYMTDLRTEENGNCTGPNEQDLCINDETESPSWQHMVTYTLGLGASGYMQYDPKYTSGGSEDFNAVEAGTDADPENGICTWQRFGPCNWPQPASNAQTNIDDLWHAAVNGRGRYYSADDYTSLAAGIKSALDDIESTDSSSSAAVLASPIITKENNLIYRATYTTITWAGQLTAQGIDESTGAVAYKYCRVKGSDPEERVECPETQDSNIEEVPEKLAWEARTPLDSRAYQSRRIFIYDSNNSDGTADKLKLFAWKNMTDGENGEKSLFKLAHLTGLSQICTTGSVCLPATQQQDWTDPDELNPPEEPAVGGINLVNFIRGERKHEDSSASNNLYRARAHVLGDIVNAEPVYVKEARFEYIDRGYMLFRERMVNRKPMVYAAANDGMLHAFHADADPSANPKGGTEEWAYIPGAIMGDLYKLADRKYADNHEFFVDATPTVGDACFVNCRIGDPGEADWRTVLVGGLGRGGKGYYALDVTDPVNPKALWEFTDSRLGYTYGNPKITKLLDGTWVVLLTSGYNNPDGNGYLFVIDLISGNLIKVISTDVGSPSNPSGLARIAAWVDYPMHDNTTLRVYAGDLLGNVWRLDVNEGPKDGGADSRYFGQLLATLEDAHGVTQPVTAKPEIGLLNGKAMVLVGTGQLLGHTDMQTRTAQSFYGIEDPVVDTVDDRTAMYGSPREHSGFVKQEFSKGGLCTAELATSGVCEKGQTIIKATRNQANDANSTGWFVDFMVDGERVDTDPALSSGILMFNTNIPRESNACESSAYSNRYFLNAETGAALLENGVAGVFLGDSLASRAVPAVVDGTRLITENTLGGQRVETGEIPPLPITPAPRRVSWTPLQTDR